jgi:hypothetical protein
VPFLPFITPPSPQHKSEGKREEKAAYKKRAEKKAATTARNKKNKAETNGDSDADYSYE